MLRESLVDAFKDVLGAKGAQAALFHLQLAHYVENPKEFHRHLCTVFGKQGAVTMERVIVRELLQKLNIPVREDARFDFEEHLNLARQVYTSRMSKGGEVV